MARKHNKPSKLDPYKDYIAELLAAGCTYGAIADKLYERYEFDTYESTLSSYCRKHNLKNRVWQGGTNKGAEPPHCSECQMCNKVKGTGKGKEWDLCIKSMAIIPRHTTTSPVWCHKRGEDNDKAFR